MVPESVSGQTDSSAFIAADLLRALAELHLHIDTIHQVARRTLKDTMRHLGAITRITCSKTRKSIRSIAADA